MSERGDPPHSTLPIHICTYPLYFFCPVTEADSVEAGLNSRQRQGAKAAATAGGGGGRGRGPSRRTSAAVSPRLGRWGEETPGATGKGGGGRGRGEGNSHAPAGRDREETPTHRVTPEGGQRGLREQPLVGSGGALFLRQGGCGGPRLRGDVRAQQPSGRREAGGPAGAPRCLCMIRGVLGRRRSHWMDRGAPGRAGRTAQHRWVTALLWVAASNLESSAAGGYY